MLVPLAIIVAIDYVALAGRILQLGLAVYIGLQFSMTLFGLYAGIRVRLDSSSPWRDILKYNYAKAFPLIAAGYAGAGWAFAMTEKADGSDTGDDQSSG